MRCPYCGKELIENAKFCDGCGATLDNRPVESQPTIQQQSNNSKSGPLVVLLFLLITGLLVYLMFFTGGSSNNESNNESNKESSNTENNNQENGNIIVNQKKQSYLDTARAFTNAVKTAVNAGRDFRFYDTSALYFVPVGDSSNCGQLENGGSSPFGKEWNYAYVVIDYTGSEYVYYFIGEDDQLYGLPLSDGNDFSDTQLIYHGHDDKITNSISEKLKELYNISENKKIDADSIGEIGAVITPDDTSVDKYIFISSSAGCEYKSSIQ